MAEELDIAVEPADCVPLTFASEPAGARHLILLLYRARRWTGEPRAMEGAALHWASVDELHALPMPPADRPFIALLNRDVASVR